MLVLEGYGGRGISVLPDQFMVCGHSSHGTVLMAASSTKC